MSRSLHLSLLPNSFSLSSIFLYSLFIFFLILPPPPRSTLFPYTTLFRSRLSTALASATILGICLCAPPAISAAGQSGRGGGKFRSEEHTSELQSRENLVCRLLLEKKKKNKK